MPVAEDQRTQSVYMLVGLIVCLSAQVLAVVAVLLVTHWFVAPQNGQNEGAWMNTWCLVEDIRVIKLPSNGSLSGLESMDNLHEEDDGRNEPLPADYNETLHITKLKLGHVISFELNITTSSYSSELPNSSYYTRRFLEQRCIVVVAKYKSNAATLWKPAVLHFEDVSQNHSHLRSTQVTFLQLIYFH